MTTTNGLRVGFVGTGWTERVQIPAFRLGGLTIQAINSGHPENAHRVADRLGIPTVFESWQELVQSEEVDIVSVATPPSLHAQIATAALAAGKHVICEKPTSLSVAEAEAMLAAAQAAPDQLAIIDHELRLTPQFQTLRAMVKEGYVGRVLWLEMEQVGGGRLDPDLPWTWWSDAGQGGGMLNALGSHMLDLGRWMIGRIDAVMAELKTVHHYRSDPQTGAQREVSADDHAQILLRFADGVVGIITVSGIVAGRNGPTVTVHGTDGALQIDRQERLLGLRGEGFPGGEWQLIELDDPVAHMTDLPNRSGYARGSVYLAQSLAEMLPQGETWHPGAASFYDGLKVQQLLEAARRSHIDRTWIRL
jgi:predicted dehydrogenase